jgi:hypothetical protein
MTASSDIRSQFSTFAPCWQYDVGTIRLILTASKAE